MSIYQISSPHSSSDIDRGLDVLRRYGNIVYLVENIGDEENLLVNNTIEKWNQESIDNLAVYWDSNKKPDFDQPFVGVANLNYFESLQNDRHLANKLKFVLCSSRPLNCKRDQRVLIVGASAFLGQAILRVFHDAFLDVDGTGFKNADSFGLDYLDITDAEQVAAFFTSRKAYDVVVYVSGEANADLAETNRKMAYALNTAAVKELASHLNNSVKFVYISTEYVFDGENAPYTSLSERSPKNYYGQTKVDAEDLTLKLFDAAIVIRMGALYGFNDDRDKKTTIGGIMNNLQAGNKINVDELQIKHPILIEDAAMTILRLLDIGACGIYQANGAEALNKVQIATQMEEVWSHECQKDFGGTIAGITSTNMADKPRNTEMVNVDTPRCLKDGIRFMLQRMQGCKADL